MKRKNFNEIFSIWQKEIPNPKTELNYANNFTLLVAVVLSAQATDVGVNKATKSLFEIVDSPEKMVKLGEEKLKKYIKSINYFNTKASNVIKLSKMLIEEFSSEVPNNFDDLISLPGVGRKTANVVLNCAFGESTIAVDTHVFRVSNRIGFVNEGSVLNTELALIKTIPKKFLVDAHHFMILHGRYVCKAQKPLCDVCKISEFCKFYKKITSNKK